MPMIMPPTTLMAVMMRPATASPRTNFEAPSMAPKKSAFFLQFFAAVLGFGFIDQAGGQVGVDRHLLAGHGIQGEARGHFGDARRTFGDDHEVHQGQNREDDDADDEAVAHDEAAERLNDVAGGGGAFVAVGQDQAGRGEVEGEAKERRDQKHHGEGVELHSLADEHDGHQDQDRERDRHRQRDIEQPCRQRHDQHDHDHDEADGETKVAALQRVADAPGHAAEVKTWRGGDSALRWLSQRRSARRHVRP